MEKRLDVLLSMVQQRAFVQTLMSSPCQPNCRALAACARSLSEGSGGSSHPSVGNCPSSPSVGLQLRLRLQDRPLKSHQLFPQRGFSQPWSMTPFCSLKLQLRNKWVALYSHYRAKQSLEGLWEPLTDLMDKWHSVVRWGLFSGYFLEMVSEQSAQYSLFLSSQNI